VKTWSTARDPGFERALEMFRRRCKRKATLADLKKNQHFETPSERKKRKRAAARRRLLQLRNGAK